MRRSRTTLVALLGLAISFGLPMQAQAAPAFVVDGVDTSRAGFLASVKSLCGAGDVAACQAKHDDAWRGLQGAWEVGLTSNYDREQLAAMLKASTTGGVTDWSAARALYAEYKVKTRPAPGAYLAGQPVYIGDNQEPRRTTCTTRHSSYRLRYVGGGTSTTTCTTN